MLFLLLRFQRRDVRAGIGAGARAGGGALVEQDGGQGRSLPAQEVARGVGRFAMRSGGSGEVGVRDAELGAGGHGLAEAFALALGERPRPVLGAHADDVVVLVDGDGRGNIFRSGRGFWSALPGEFGPFPSHHGPKAFLVHRARF